MLNLLNFKKIIHNKRLILLIGVICISIVFIIWITLLITQKAFYNGIFIENINISGLNRSEAKALIQEKIVKNYYNNKIVLKYNNNTWELNLDDITFSLLTDDALDNAYKIGRSGNIFIRLSDILSLKVHKKNISTRWAYDRTKLSKFLFNIKDKIDEKEKDASVTYTNGKITINNEVIGKTLDIDKNINILENQISNKDFVVHLEVDDKKPRVTYDDIKEIEQVLGSFSTVFNSNDYNRSYNIRLASKNINNLVLFPGEIFSMNKALGPRTNENGYLNAPVIFKNELVEGLGGGVCQVTSTLYNVVLKSKMEIIERQHHSMTLGYVDAGRDATIAENYIDLKFQNNKDYPVIIIADTKGNMLNIKILGKREKEELIVDLKSVVVEELIPDGEELIVDDSVLGEQKVVVREPKNGCRAIVYRYTYNKDRKLLSSEKISEDVYNPIKAQIKVNRKYYDKLTSATY